MKPAADSKTVKLRILDKEVQIGCAAGEEDDLSRAAKYVDTSMREFRGRNLTSTAEKIAILTAINIANELMKVKSVEASQDAVRKKISDMQSQVNTVLEEN